jgi:Domain of unknown function (DUF4145)
MSSHIGTDNQLVKFEWVHCNYCLHPTKHSVLSEHNRKQVEKHSGYDIWWNTRYTLFTCLGCESITLRRELTCSEWDDGFEIEFSPPQVSRQLPKWRDELPKEIRDLMTEVYTALHSDSRRLALMGARTLIDMFVLDKIGDVGTFKEKLQALIQRGYLGSQQESVLNVALEAGNAASHRGYQPSSEDLNHVIDIVENLLQSYALEKASNSVKGKIPTRSKTRIV